MVGGGPASIRKQGVAGAVLGRGRPSRARQAAGFAVLAVAVREWPAARRSIMETATRNAADGTAAITWPQAVGWA